MLSDHLDELAVLVDANRDVGVLGVGGLARLDGALATEVEQELGLLVSQLQDVHEDGFVDDRRETLRLRHQGKGVLGHCTRGHVAHKGRG